MERDPDGRLIVNERSKTIHFHEEDILFMGVPVGKLTYGFSRFTNMDLRGIESIGRFCSIASGVSFADTHHPLKWVSTNPFLYYANRGIVDENVPMPKKTKLRNRRIVVGHDVWIGEGVKILRPTVVGHGSVIAAGSVVTRDVPPYAIVGGVPAKFIKWRIAEDLIPKMLGIAWWDWDLATIRLHRADFYDPDGFVRKHHVSAEDEVQPKPAKRGLLRSILGRLRTGGL